MIRHFIWNGLTRFIVLPQKAIDALYDENFSSNTLKYHEINFKDILERNLHKIKRAEPGTTRLELYGPAAEGF